MNTLDVSGLPHEKVDQLQRLVNQWRQEEAEKQTCEKATDEDIIFTTQKSKVIGALTRRLFTCYKRDTIITCC